MRYNFMTAGEDGCSKVMFSSLLVAIKVDGSEISLRAAMKTDDTERLLLVVLVAQGIAASCNQGRWQQQIAVDSIVQREMRAAVKGIKEI
ncbi:hypothetical protein B296_00020082 [Ensete ventricosum]|uniref:Uncharacterized protein n=1 Tax=Ensete ventricosum TaxID=4639 RepID=A0A426YRJ8_ENSVE|nr:hypothetical protein B296_00020082 [Ensete ventricosum]